MSRKLLSQILPVELLNRVLLNDYACQSIFIDWCDLRMSTAHNKQNELRYLNRLYDNIIDCHNEYYPERYVLITQLFDILFNDCYDHYNDISNTKKRNIDECEPEYKCDTPNKKHKM
jgi:hypothetical protein